MPAFTAPMQQILDTVALPPGADIRAERVSYSHDGTALEGCLVWDAAVTERRPGILVVHDWMGEDEYTRVRAEMLARLGYVAFAADVYGAATRPADAEEAAQLARGFYSDLSLLRGRVTAGLDVLRHDTRVDADRLAAIGYCFGGSGALELARTGAPLRATVSFHGSLLPRDPAEVDAIRGPLLVLTGAADPVVPDSEVRAFADELRTRDDLDWQVVAYSGAPHAFTRPSSPAYRPTADSRSWIAMREFFAETLV